MSPKTKKKLWLFILYLLMAVIVLVCLFPVLWMILISIKSIGERVSGFDALRIVTPTLANYQRLFDIVNVWQHTLNSIFTAVMGTITTLVFCSLAGFAFAKYKFPGHIWLFYFVVATMTIPTEVGAIPTFLIMRQIGLINNLWSLVIPRMTTAIGIFYLRQYIMEVPDEIMESARIDGCSDLGIFTRIIVPIIKPALASWASITLIARWNDFFWPLLFLTQRARHTLMVSVSLLPLSDGLATPWQVILAGTTWAIVPSIILYLFMQFFQKAGLTAGAVKG